MSFIFVYSNVLRTTVLMLEKYYSNTKKAYGLLRRCHLNELSAIHSIVREGRGLEVRWCHWVGRVFPGENTADIKQQR